MAPNNNESNLSNEPTIILNPFTIVVKSIALSFALYKNIHYRENRLLAILKKLI